MVGDSIYVIGGSTDNNELGCATNTCYIWSLANGKWEEGPTMHNSRQLAQCAVVGKKIYVIGGLDEYAQNMTSCEVLDTETRTWKKIADMKEERCLHAVVTLDDVVYAIGGGSFPTDTVEKYDPQGDVWTPLPNMKTPVNRFCATVFDGQIFVVGGCDGSNNLRSVQVFNPSSNEWNFVADMNEVRSNAVVYSHGEALFVASGRNEEGAKVQTMEKYDKATNKWTLLSTECPNPPDILKSSRVVM